MSTKQRLLAIVTITSIFATGHAFAESPATPRSRAVTYKVVQTTPQYDLRRPEVVSGARVTLFANFLLEERGYVLLTYDGTSHPCRIVEWKRQSVTVELPRLGLTVPKNAVIHILRPDGDSVKTFHVLYVAQPEIVVHEDTIPQPNPPVPTTDTTAYMTPVIGGLMLQARN